MDLATVYLGGDALLLIVKRLGAADLCRATAVCRALRDAERRNEEELWRRLVLARWLAEEDGVLDVAGVSFKKTYVLLSGQWPSLPRTPAPSSLARLGDLERRDHRLGDVRLD